MKLFKTKIYAVMAACLSAMTFSSCDDVEPGDRFVEMPQPEIGKTVLLMDFTGQRCVNCPEAHEVMAELVKQYGDTALVTVSIHAGGMATSVDRTNFERNNIGLMIEEGNEINDAFGITQWPMGVVDRINAPGAAINSGQWANAVYQAISQPADVRIKASASLEDNLIKVNTTLTAQDDLQAALQIWVVEDSIVARQETMSGRVNDYVHNNVLRDVVFPVKEGLPLSLRRNIEHAESASIETKWTDKERWNTRHLSIVAFVYQGTNIINTIRVPLNTK